jgi:hypothetical protein
MRNDRQPATVAPTLRLERLVAFSDAVLAIAITLLVLGLEVPSVHKVPEQQLPEYLIDSIPSVLAYITSFFLVGMYWLQHYVIFHYVLHANRPWSCSAARTCSAAWRCWHFGFMPRTGTGWSHQRFPARSSRA